jgi:hypothetical protein
MNFQPKTWFTSHCQIAIDQYSHIGTSIIVNPTHTDCSSAALKQNRSHKRPAQAASITEPNKERARKWVTGTDHCRTSEVDTPWQNITIPWHNVLGRPSADIDIMFTMWPTLWMLIDVTNIVTRMAWVVEWRVAQGDSVQHHWMTLTTNVKELVVKKLHVCTTICRQRSKHCSTLWPACTHSNAILNVHNSYVDTIELIRCTHMYHGRLFLPCCT